MNLRHLAWVVLLGLVGMVEARGAQPGPLLAGAAKVEITNKKVFPVNDPLYVKALVLKRESLF